MTLNFITAKCATLLALTLGTGLIAGCGSNGVKEQATAAQNQEKERLQAENQELAEVRQENREVQRLRKENEELPKLRNQYQEAGRLRKDNEQLRQQIAKISPAAASGHAAGGADAQGTNALRSGSQSAEKPKETAAQEPFLNEGDDIMVDPKDLKVLLPEFDWEKLGRKEPLGIRAVLERDGSQITNAAQLKELGITNFIIQRAQPPPQPQPPAPETR